MGLPLVTALVWTGCGDDETGDAAGPRYVDPGGTHGAEIVVTIKGRGRVTTNVPGLDCPSDCFAKYVFASATADGAAGSIALKATPTPGSRFSGWSFRTEPIGSRGRGPANCNPVLRTGSTPAIDETAAEIELPYGETTGTPPAGQEGACSAFTKVPVVYNVTATFDTDPPIPDSGDELPEIVYEPPIPGAVGGEIGITQGGYVYWHFTAGGASSSGIAFGSSPSGVAPQTPTIVVDPTLVPSSITLFEVDPYGVAFQNGTGAIGVIRYGSTSPMMVSGSPPTCNALAVDSSFNVYCRTSSTIVQWLYASGYATPNVLYTELPSGNDLVVESAVGSMYFSSANAILSLPVMGADGSIATPTTVVSDRIGPTNLESNGSRLFWLESGGYVYASASKSAPTFAYDTSVPPSPTIRHLAADPNNPSYFWVASSTAIYHAFYFGGTGPDATEPLRTKMTGIAGMTAGSTYVYTSHADGTIRRTNRSSL